MAMGNLASRFLVAGLLAPIIILAMYQDRPEYFWAIVFAGSLIGMYEFFSMTVEDQTDRLVSLVCGAGAVAAMYWLPGRRGGELLACFVAVVPVALYYLFRFGDMTTAAPRFGASVTGIVYAGMLLTFLALIKRDFGSDGGDLVLLVLLIGWLGDTSAYFAGRFLGKRKLYPAVSPGKTWAGVYGAFILVLVYALAAASLLGLPMERWVLFVGLSVAMVPVSVVGDLFESLLKRQAGLKDSSHLLPGHGGMLDRIDSLTAAAPLFMLGLTWLGMRA